MNKSRMVKAIVSMAYLISVVIVWRWISLGTAITLVAVGFGLAAIIYFLWLGDYKRSHPDAGYWDLRIPEKTGEDKRQDLLCEWVYLSWALVMISFFLIFFGSQMANR